ncbi:MAG: hypothetical protein QNK25_06010 [Desulfobacterales bacterium]|nr:hypothetical protein [Desulfobacterales bacterium]
MLTNNCAMISEQGRRYIGTLICNFEVIWACATQINGMDPSKANFRVRLEQYADLMEKFFRTEQKQIIFRLLSRDEDTPVPGTIINKKSLTLYMLYQSLLRAMESAINALGSEPQTGRTKPTNLTIICPVFCGQSNNALS